VLKHLRNDSLLKHIFTVSTFSSFPTAVESVLLNELNEDRDSKTECPSSNSRSCENELGVKKKYGLADLVKTPQIRRQIFIQSYQW